MSDRPSDPVADERVDRVRRDVAKRKSLPTGRRIRREAPDVWHRQELPDTPPELLYRSWTEREDGALRLYVPMSKLEWDGVARMVNRACGLIGTARVVESQHCRDRWEEIRTEGAPAEEPRRAAGMSEADFEAAQRELTAAEEADREAYLASLAQAEPPAEEDVA
jgi:hypothetical protein